MFEDEILHSHLKQTFQENEGKYFENITRICKNERKEFSFTLFLFPYRSVGDKSRTVGSKDLIADRVYVNAREINR